MSTPPPIPCLYAAGVFAPLDRFRKVAAEHYGEGEVVSLVPHEDRSMASHGHYFVTLNELWRTIPEGLNDRYPTFESFRKAGLIATGHCDTDTVVCATKAEAERVAAAVRRHASESITVIRGAVVTVYTAHSQSMRAMGKADFQKSKDDVLAWAGAQVGVEDSPARDAAGGQRPREAA